MYRCSITDDKNSDHKLLGKRRINRIILRLDISPAEDIKDITRWREDMFKPPCNIFFII